VKERPNGVGFIHTVHPVTKRVDVVPTVGASPGDKSTRNDEARLVIGTVASGWCQGGSPPFGLTVVTMTASPFARWGHHWQHVDQRSMSQAELAATSRRQRPPSPTPSGLTPRALLLLGCPGHASSRVVPLSHAGRRSCHEISSRSTLATNSPRSEHGYVRCPWHL
jgi:hypothetical protein